LTVGAAFADSQRWKMTCRRPINWSPHREGRSCRSTGPIAPPLAKRVDGVGCTGVGRMTVTLLHISAEYRVGLRDGLIQAGVFPTTRCRTGRRVVRPNGLRCWQPSAAPDQSTSACRTEAHCAKSRRSSEFLWPRRTYCAPHGASRTSRPRLLAGIVISPAESSSGDRRAEGHQSSPRLRLVRLAHQSLMLDPEGLPVLPLRLG
jgi:hypothetical protein